jgi:Tol biopolymer transport system component
LLCQGEGRIDLLSVKTRKARFFGRGINFETNRQGTVAAWQSTDSCSRCRGPILVKRTSGGVTRRLGGYAAVNYGPTLSPDGRRVAFSRSFWSYEDLYETHGGIWISPTSGRGRPKRLTPVGYCAAWSPNGRRIAFHDGKRMLMISSAGGPVTELADFLPFCTSPRFTAPWSPDSRYLAVVRNEDWHVVVVDVATRRARDVTGDAVGSVISYAWSPESSRLAVVGRDARDCTSMWVVGVQRAGYRRLRTC